MTSEVVAAAALAAEDVGVVMVAIARHVEQALVLADTIGDKLLGAKLSECLEHVRLSQ